MHSFLLNFMRQILKGKHYMTEQNKKIPFPLITIKENVKLRKSQEKIIELAEKAFNKGDFNESLLLYKRINDVAKNKIERKEIDGNIRKIIEMLDKYPPKNPLKNQEKNPPKKTERQKQNKEPALNLPNLSNLQDQELSLKIDNISLSGIEISAGSKIMDVFEKIIPQKYNEQSINEDYEVPKLPKGTDNEKDHIESAKEIKEIEEIKKEYIEKFEKEGNPLNLSDKEAVDLENTSVSEEHTEKRQNKHTNEPKHQKLNNDKHHEKETSQKNESINNEEDDVLKIAPEIDKLYKDGSSKNVDDIEAKLKSGNNDEPIKVQQVAPTKKIEKIKPLNLTYNFTNVFHNKFYVQHSNMFNEAARLVSERKLDDAIDYYKVLLDQKLPETMKIMIKQNIKDLELSIINTFKYANTIVDMDESGRLTSLDSDSDTVKIIEQQDYKKDDVYFKE